MLGSNNSLSKSGDFDSALIASTGCKDKDVAASLLSLCCCACSPEKETVEESFLTMVKAMTEIAPKDLVEGMLATRFWSLHTRGMALLSGGGCSINLAMKLLRLSSETLDTLLKWRRKGEQRVLVSHLTVADGTVVGNISEGGG